MASNQYNPRRPQPVAAKKKTPSGASKPGRAQLPGWLWLVAGVAVGVFVSFLIKLAGMPATTSATINNSATPVAVKSSEKPVKTAALETKKIESSKIFMPSWLAILMMRI